MFMKSISPTVTLVFMALLAVPVSAAELEASLLGDGWDGVWVPDSQVCQRFGGRGATPPMRIAGLPAGTTHIEVSFNDESFGPMDGGGHGKLSFAVAAGQSVVDLPAVPGETDDLPDGVTKINGHRGADWSGTDGAYLPPCSGGRDNSYTASIRAVVQGDGGKRTLARTKIGIGRY